MISAVLRSLSATCSIFSCGKYEETRAAAPATIGEDIEVPPDVVKEAPPHVE
ncbi:hypothetical protein SDC9_59551 [bioreactor metagenome]|uniref:Uncharacterized protein n=1 Tax=bioreactor metagenome TaxID=1076179 RepID=A0A644XAE0_9ZZZZ